MPQSLPRLLVHIIFSTKHRRPLILPEIRQELCSYLGGILKGCNCPPIEINCPPDHVHILCGLSKTRSLADVVEQVKKSSSKWVKTKSPALKGFYWQAGYGAFSVSPSKVEEVRAYIARQLEHHKKTTFQDEFRAFLRLHGIEFDERYVWD